MQNLAFPAVARAAILAWFDAGRRDVPLRRVRDPYAILVSEIMAQQTQIGRAAATWDSFMARFPTVEALARAAPASVIREWRGLGYNRRALNLRRAARLIVTEHGGQVPSDPDVLQRLPGIGPYTARAVAAFAFGRAVGPVDTNVRRVLGRIVGGARQPAARDLQALADDVTPAARPADWTHALMDLGATVCRPARPRCGECPARAWCRFASEPVAPDVVPAGRRGLSFTTTSRWLRGRLLDRLRDAPDEAWVQIAGPLGVHDAEAIDRALRAMAGDGLVERDPSEPLRARLPVA